MKQALKLHVWIGVLALAWAGSGCATATKLAGVTEDHTVRLVTRPVSAPAELAWRVRTFGVFSAGRAQVRYRRFPRLARQLPPPALDPFDLVPENPAVARVIARYGESPVPGNVTFRIGGEAVFPPLEAHLAAATNRIDIQTYIFDNDAYALAFADLLRERGAAGTDVRILLDPIGTRNAWTVHPAGAPDPPRGRGFNTVRYLRRGDGVRVRRTPNVWLSSDHVKFITIDGHVAYLGGMNIGWEYRYDWRDMMSELSGPVVRELEAYFDSAWRRAGWLGEFELLSRLWRPPLEHVADPEHADLHFLVTTPWRHRYFQAILASIDAATHRVYVETPYLWNQQIQLALCKARHRGVDVRVVVPMETNVALARGADRMTANTLLRHGVRVFLYPGMTHKKATLIDDWAFWGSANKDDLSLHKNMELNLATDHGPTVAELESILLEGQDTATEVLDFIPTGTWDRLSRRLTNLL